MAILIDENTTFLIQGITGKQGQRTCEEMLHAGSKLIAGVTPGKGGQEVEGVPVYNSIKEAPKVSCSVILVPPKFAKTAILEAIESKIPLINIVTENIPVHDMAYCFAKAKEHNIRIIGPTSAGINSVGKSKCGPIGSGKSKVSFTEGNIGIISRSGGMASETSLVLKQAGLGQSTVVSIGSDILMGESFKELIQDFEQDPETKGLVLFGEIGGTAEEDLAEYLTQRATLYPKPIVAFISGTFVETYKIQNVSLGHAGAIIEGNKGTRKAKVKALKEAGVLIAEVHHEVGDIMKKALQNGI
jgi:succinyl-CoA synthetase alpha subunit